MVFCLLWLCKACKYFIEGVLANIVEIWCFIVYLCRVFLKTILLYYQFIFFLFGLLNINFNILLLFIFILKNLKILIKFSVFIFQGSFIFSHLFNIIWFTYLFINIFIFKSKSQCWLFQTLIKWCALKLKLRLYCIILWFQFIFDLAEL